MFLNDTQSNLLGPVSPGIIAMHDRELFFKFAMQPIVLQIRVAIASNQYKGVK